MSHIPEDRHKHGLVLDFTLEQNMVLQRFNEPRFENHGFINNKAVRDYANYLIDKFDVRSGQGAITRARSMSGGNQQKAIIAREVDRDKDLIVAVQPTRGLDVGAIEFIHSQLVAERDRGKAILLVSLELDEVMSLSDRILVMYEGEIVGELDPKKPPSKSSAFTWPAPSAWRRRRRPYEKRTLPAKRRLQDRRGVRPLDPDWPRRRQHRHFDRRPHEPEPLALLAWDGIRIVFGGLFSTGRDASGTLTWGFNPTNIGNMLFRAAPLIMTGLSVGMAYKTGLFNIGAPGQYLIGTLVSLSIALGLPSETMSTTLIWLLAFLGGTLAGAIWGAIPGLFKALLNINEVLACIMTNWIAANLVTWLFDISNFKNVTESTKTGYIYKTTYNASPPRRWALTSSSRTPRSMAASSSPSSLPSPFT